MTKIYDILGFESPEAAAGLLFLLVIILFIICVILIVLFVKASKRGNCARQVYNAPTPQPRRGGRSDRDRFTYAAKERIELLEENQRYLTQNIDDLYRKLRGTYQKLGVVKYNAYSRVGGNISFVLAMLDETNSGFIINVMNGREGSQTYMKEVTNGKTTERLGKEEQHALMLAIDPEYQ